MYVRKIMNGLRNECLHVLTFATPVFIILNPTYVIQSPAYLKIEVTIYIIIHLSLILDF